MGENVFVPSLGTTVKNAKITRWMITEGQPVEKATVIGEIETERVNYLIEASIVPVFCRTCKICGKNLSACVRFRTAPVS